jgi:alpha-glucosidase (family GH31 glycosyl hydrolase)
MFINFVIISTTGNVLSLKTEKLFLTYNSTSGIFSQDNLKISFEMQQTTVNWYPGKPNPGNLLGTLRTLDDTDGPVELDCAKQNNSWLFCTYGLISKDGWVVVDETQRPVMSKNTEWQFWVDEAPSSDIIDWYFLGYGREYKRALKEYTLLSGPIPLPPRYMFGIFFSRYWAYSDADLRDVIRQYEVHQVPLDVLVTDMV